MSLNTIKECILEGRTLTSLEKRIFIEKSITTHEGKMEGIPSISTSVLMNHYCKMRRNNKGCICSACYAASYAEFRKSLGDKLEVNTVFYTTYELTKKDIPQINSLFFRFESFGDIQNTLQVKNFATIARANKHCSFVLWTKNPWIIKKAIEEGLTLPKNFRVIYSLPKVNQAIDNDLFRKIKKAWPFVSKAFAVYDKETVIEQNTDINCGSRSCLNCRKCYDTANRVKLIREQKK